MLQADIARHAPEQTAVLLNANAKQVSARVRNTLSGLVPAESLFLSRDRDDAHRIADEVVSRGFRTVFTGGGDGTFVSWVNHILDRAETRSAPSPRFGILALGTGNAVAELIGAGRPVDDLRRHLSGEVLPGRRLDLVSIEGRRTPFASAGLDAAVLNDYNWLRTRLNGRAGGLASGIAGYGLAIALRSAPRQVLQRTPPYCEIVNTGAPAWRLDGAGERSGRPIANGELLYAGP
jgi:diacylglycerol kinase family enzyme